MIGLRKRMQVALLKKLDAYARQEDGVATIFALFVIMMMIAVGGISIDLMRNELDRVTLQQVSDRAALAAADLDQTLDPEAVVADYFDKAGMSQYLSSVTVDQGLKYRIVDVQTAATTKTQWMHFMGVDELTAPASSKAEERISKVEVSLVLDISGSMADNNKMAELQEAARTFVNAVIRPETQNLVSINLIPYSEHVNVGPDIFNELNTINRHPFSHCVEIPDSEFSSTALNTSITYDQMQHYQWNYSGSNSRTDTVCPRYSYERITPMSQSVADLELSINSFQPRAGTSIFMGVKWAAALLDPSTRPMMSNLIAAGKVDPTFEGRPLAYEDEEVLKTIVVMTDGKHDRSMRIANWAYNSTSEYYHWANYNFWYYLNNYVYYQNHPYYYWQKYDAVKGDTLLNDICTASKDNNIVIWGVGFEVDDHGSDVIENCASSPSHYFRVENTEIKDAFAAIASQINQLRLTQ